MSDKQEDNEYLALLGLKLKEIITPQMTKALSNVVKDLPNHFSEETLKAIGDSFSNIDLPNITTPEITITPELSKLISENASVVSNTMSKEITKSLVV